jgi:glycosyltransferase involved in cell wall biosynthesis
VSGPRAGHATPRIGIDFSTLDATSSVSGQHRYVADLIRGLASLDAPGEYLVIGSGREPPDSIAEVFRTTAGPWRYVRSAPDAGRLALVTAQLRLAWLAAREGLDLLHATHAPVPVLAPCPVVATVYDLMQEMFPEYEAIAASRAHRWYRYAIRRRVRRIIAISGATAADLRERWGVSGDRVDVVRLGTRFSGAAAARAAAPADGPASDRARTPLLVSPYNLEPRKNLATLVRAGAALRGRWPSLRLALYGRAAVTPPREAEFERLLAAEGMGEAVDRVGVLDDAGVAALSARADVFVFPSLYEGFGLPVLEAMAVGACVVAHRAPAMVEVLGGAGVLTDASSADALADSIAGLLDAPERAAALRAAARVRAATFTIERMCRETYASYTRALGGVAPR